MMDNDSVPLANEKLTAFLAAIEKVGVRSGGAEIALHHSAVEVNGWDEIQKAMVDATQSK